MTITQAAAALGITREAVHKRLRKGMMRGELAGGTVWLIPVAEVERWQALGKQSPGPKPKGKDGQAPAPAATSQS